MCTSNAQVLHRKYNKTNMKKKKSSKHKRQRRVSTITLVVIILLAVAVTFRFCKPLRRTNTPLTEQSSRMLNIPFNKQGELAFISHATSDTLALIDIELANTDVLRARGLMYRESIPEYGGMLFLMEREQFQSFWMRNTYISLDILFVNANREIVTIHANTTPLCERGYNSTAPALYVVEVNAGFSERNNIRVGDFIQFIIDN